MSTPSANGQLNIPHNIEAEQGVLGAIILDNAMIAEVVPILRVDDFYRDVHQVIYRAIVGLHERGIPCDGITLAEELSRRGEFERIGGNETMAQVLGSTSQPANAKYYAQIVRQKSFDRDLIDGANAIIRDASSDCCPIDELANRVETWSRTLSKKIVVGTRPKEYATLADAVKLIGDMRWLWEGWIPFGVMTLLAAKAGDGKTRATCDLVRRIYHGEPWPDGTPSTLPKGTRTLWLPIDRNWKEVGGVLERFGVPLEAIQLNSPKSDPLSVRDLDDPYVIADLAEQIRDTNPGLVVVDTITYATVRNTARAEEVKTAFDGLLNLSADTKAAILALAHLNLSGGVLNCRIIERARSVIKLSCPDPDGQPNRRKLWVDKSPDKKPPALGITFSDDPSTFDDNPPTEPEVVVGPRGPAPAKSLKHAEWLWDQLSQGPVAIVTLVDLARTDGLMKAPSAKDPKPSITPLYNARDRIPKIRPGFIVEELEAQDGPSGRWRKSWHITQAIPEEDLPPF